MNIMLFLDQLEKLEDRLGALYRHYGEMLSADGELSALFYSLYREEGAHRNLVRFQRQFLRGRAVAAGLEVPDDGRTDRLIQRIETQLVTRAAPTPEAALRTAFEIEFHSAEIHGPERIQSLVPELVDLFRRLGSGDQSHYNTLVQAAHARGIVPAAESDPPTGIV